MVGTPHYYVNDFPTVTGDLSSGERLLAGRDANALRSQLSEALKVINKPTTLNFLIKNSALEFVGQAIEVDRDPLTEQFKVNGEVILKVAGGTAIDKAVTAILTALGIGTGIIGVVVGGIAKYLIWDALSETEGVQAIENLIDSVIRSARGAVPVNLQILDANGNVLGGALFSEDIDKAAEFEAIKTLLARATQDGADNNAFPNVSAGVNKIRAVDRTIFSSQQRVYELYDGTLIDIVSQALGITKASLLSSGKKDNPNNNEQIYFSSSTSSESFIFIHESYFTQDSNRLFIPLPTESDGESARRLHPSNILISGENRNVLDAYLANDPSSPFFNQDALLIGTGVSNDSLKGSGGNDVFVGGKGNDEIDGRQSGEDIAIFSENYKDYDISFSTNGSVTIAHLRGTQTDGTDTLTNVEFAKFKDGTLSLTDSLQNRPSQRIGSYEFKQVSLNDVVGSVPVISGTQVFWQEKVGSSLLSDERTIRFDTNTGLLSGITSNTTDSSYTQLPVNEDKILLSVDYNDRSPHKLELYTGESLVPVGNVSDFDNRAIIFGDNVLLETRSSSRPRQLVAYNYKNGKTTPLAEKKYSNSSTLPDFLGVSYVVKSGNKIAWVGSIGNSNDTDIFLYDGNTTIQIPKIPKIDGNGSTYAIPDVSNLQLDGNNVFWTSSNPINRGFTDLFLYNGVETKQIAEVASQPLASDFKLSGSRVVWTTKGGIRNTPNSLYLYDGGSIKSIYEVEKTTELSTAGIRNLTFSGENIVWTETVAAASNPRIAVGQDFYLYDIGNSNAQPTLLSNDQDTLLYDLSFKLFGEQVAWTAPDNVGKTQLYTYDGNSVWQLTNLPPNNGGYGNYISQFEVSEKGVVWIGDDDGEMDRSFKVGEEIFVATLIREGGIENNPATPTPIPTPTPTPTPDPIPIPTPTPPPEPTPVLQLTGTNGRDRLTGDAGNNVLTGLGGNDILNGRAGRDRLIGGMGKDTLTGGADADQFVFDIGRRFNLSLMGIDVITDFQRPDKIVLDRTTFKALQGNRVSFQSVKTVAQAKSSKSLITYVRSTGALFYNQNGKASGFGQGGQFADFKNGLNLAASDFIVQA